MNPDVGMMQARIGKVFGQLKKDDLVLFYFTGHGIKDMAGKFYLSTAQTEKFENDTLNPGTAVSADFVKGVIGNSLAQRKVVILDCCFGAAFAKGFLGMDDSSIDVEAQLGGKGWCVLTASTSTKYALEQEGEDLSVYTRYLVEGLKTGGAAPDGQESISIGNLHQYLYTQVKAAAPAMEPTIFNGLAGTEIAIAKVQVDNLQRYRKQVQHKVKNGLIRPAALANLKQQQTMLKVSDGEAAAILAEVLKPYEEKVKHVKTYTQALRAEKDYTYPLDDEAIEELEELKRQLNLRDEDVQAAEKEILGHVLKQPFQAQPKATNSPPQPSIIKQYPTFDFKTAKVDDKGNVIETIQGQTEYFSEDLGDGVTLEMVRIPGGTFMMGSPKDEAGRNLYGEWDSSLKGVDVEGPQHQVTMPEFWMGKFAVTQEQWQTMARLKKISRDLEGDPAHFKGKKRPVEQVSWEDAEEFCKRLSQKTGKEYTLPSEAQWEYACRAGTTTPFHFGATITPELVNYDGNYIYGNGPKGKYCAETTEVGSFAIASALTCQLANPFGLYDMHGNVWEWCLDGWHENYKDAPNDGSKWESSDERKVLRGGSWSNNPDDCRSAVRSRNARGSRGGGIGFRVVCFPPRT
ncbi:SUMF1/EgtB/PvdO family nonheme iron enzyme [Leptothoe sp. PORK10 BA2]|uniref:SUMF1/EgtB/PvdO family nonheme iron enzyme n=1 Tax=Leptothoe sp. PORK10 BA2 TaxID=3110254 RepID=UPI002B1F0D5C|nr:SUMF1/EgtB/PvdO family nonheme iron enzyme [Leptothoe sp. PORK10 BA2]MEA5464350.1 SUMF1/EgtB/PvdO family nonheme iron enzyme [Leptothoe sp. PORK10 BA2]